eukprot:8181078-Karenia_brevis.AAC.1
MGEPLGPQEELCTGKQGNLWEINQSPTQVRTFGDATKAPQRQMREHFGRARGALNKQTRRPLGRQPEPGT